MPTDRANRALLVAIACVLVATGLLLAYAALRGRAGPSPTPPAAAAIEPTRPPAEPHFARTPRGSVLLWVDPTGWRAFQRAYQNRDDRGMERAVEIFEQIEVPDSTPIRVTNREGEAVQVELLDGPQKGRRGWLAAALVIER